MAPQYILCTGGAGFVGSHTVIRLLEEGYKVAILDNLSNSTTKVLDRIRSVMNGHKVTDAVDKSKKLAEPALSFFQMDLVTDAEKVDSLFKKERFDAVIHFASLKAVGESIEMPLAYYRNNIQGAISLMETMTKNNCKTLIFSSSATVYKPQDGDGSLDESQPLGPTNPYGQTKLFIEQIMQDVYVSDKTWSMEILRYFNPTGAHQSGLLGEHPSGIPNNLMPFVQQVAVGKREKLNVFGNDWPTEDGTCIRDFIHVMDLAAGHVSALKYRLSADGKPRAGCGIHNLGTGNGYSVLQMVEAFKEACVNDGHTKEFVVEFTGRRAGDICRVVSNPAQAKTDFGWQAKLGLKEMCADAWRWQKHNPNGYES